MASKKLIGLLNELDRIEDFEAFVKTASREHVTKYLVSLLETQNLVRKEVSTDVESFFNEKGLYLFEDALLFTIELKRYSLLMALFMRDEILKQEFSDKFIFSIFKTFHFYKDPDKVPYVEILKEFLMETKSNFERFEELKSNFRHFILYIRDGSRENEGLYEGFESWLENPS